MKITLLFTGKTSSAEIKLICDDYRKRLNHYMKTEEVVPDNSSVKITDTQKVKEKEGELILKKITPTDFVVLLDDKGKEFTSVQFAQYMENIFNQRIKNLVFLVICKILKLIWVKKNRKLLFAHCLPLVRLRLP